MRKKLINYKFPHASSPKIPSEWSGFTAQRKFRGKTLSLTVTNRSDVKQMTVNGEVVESNFVDLALYEDEEIAIAVHR